MEELNQEEICLNQGGIRSIWIALLNNPNSFFPLLFEDDSAQYRRSRKRSKEGTKIVHTLDLNIQKGREDIENWLQDHAEDYFIIQITDMNGMNYTMGTTDYPVELLDELNPGRQPTDRNEYDFNFDCELPL